MEFIGFQSSTLVCCNLSTRIYSANSKHHRKQQQYDVAETRTQYNAGSNLNLFDMLDPTLGRYLKSDLFSVRQLPGRHACNYIHISMWFEYNNRSGLSSFFAN